MRHQLLIRPATLNDAAVLAHIQTIARAAAMPWLPKVHTDEQILAWMATTVIPAQRVRVAAIDGIPVGFAASIPGWLEHLYIHPNHHSLGIGSRLFNDVYMAASEPIRFWVFQRNAIARRFYERRGSRLIQLTDGANNEEREPDALYEKPIPRRLRGAGL